MLITPLQAPLREAVWHRKTVEKFRANPMEIANWIKKRTSVLNPDTKALQIAQTPVGAVKFKITRASARARPCFFVDITRRTQYRGQARYGHRCLRIMARMASWTIDSRPKVRRPWHVRADLSALLHLDEPLLKLPLLPQVVLKRWHSHAPQLRRGWRWADETSWMNAFKVWNASLEAGTYLLTTGTRPWPTSSSSCLSHSEFFVIKEGQTTTVPLIMRESKDEVQVIGSFNSESKFDMDGNQVSLRSRRRVVATISSVSLASARSLPTMRSWTLPRRLTPSTVGAVRLAPALRDLPRRPRSLTLRSMVVCRRTSSMVSIPDGAIRQQMVENLKLSSKTQLPIFFIADTFNRCRLPPPKGLCDRTG